MLSLDSVSFRSGDRVLLDAVSFSLAPGQFYGVIGHNGAGKSTLIRLLGGELLPSSGAVLLDGAAVHAFSAKARARRIASLPQKLPDVADFLVRELVMLGRFPWQGWLQRPSAEDVACVEAAMAQTDVARFAAQPVNTLSGGERQRAWLALCLAQQSEVLLLDEPLAALAGAAAMALGVYLSKHRRTSLPVLAFTGWQLFIGGLFLLPVALLAEPRLESLSPVNIGGYLYLSLFGAVLAYVLFFRGIAKLSPAAVSSLGLLSPVSAFILGWLFLGQGMDAKSLAGFALVLVSIFGVQRAVMKKVV